MKKGEDKRRKIKRNNKEGKEKKRRIKNIKC
jgi:hypothetical protein